MAKVRGFSVWEISHLNRKMLRMKKRNISIKGILKLKA
jgi:hypothetical protein